MGEKILAWTKEYHTPTVGTTYHIVIRDEYIALQALDKPYKVTVSRDDLAELL